jgi:hypothetical protein
MKPYKTVTDYPVSIRAIHGHLGFKHKLPKDFTWEGPLKLFEQGWPHSARLLGEFYVVVTKSVKAGKPRIFVKHKGRLVPAGRLAQAKDEAAPTPRSSKVGKALHVMMEDLTEDEERHIGEMLVEALYLKKDTEHKGRFQTSWGTKYPLGVYRTIIGQIKQSIKDYETKA